MDCNGCSQWSVRSCAFENVARLKRACLRVSGIGKLPQSNWNRHRAAIESGVCGRSNLRSQRLGEIDRGFSWTGMSKLYNGLSGCYDLPRSGLGLDNYAVSIPDKLRVLARI